MSLHILDELVQGSDAWHDQRRGIVTVPLTRGHVAIVDAPDADSVLGVKWHVIISRGTTYAGWRLGNRVVRMHNFLTGESLVDHINGNGLDNRRSNLRPATHAENARNRRTPSTNTSGFKGVSWHGHRAKWCAYITADGRRRSLGYYDSAQRAALAYNAAALELHGEFASLNPVGGAK